MAEGDKGDPSFGYCSMYTKCRLFCVLMLIMGIVGVTIAGPDPATAYADACPSCPCPTCPVSCCPSDAWKSTVRIESHGGSGVIIHSEKDKTLVLTAAHLFFDDEGNVDRNLTGKEMTVDFYSEGCCVDGIVGTGIVKIDPVKDLALVEFKYGPVVNVARVAAPLTLVDGDLISAGHDRMFKTPTVTRVSVHSVRGNYTLTHQMPYFGRSGGPLFTKNGELVGICHGFLAKSFNSTDGLGMFVSHASLTDFLLDVGFMKDKRKKLKATPNGKAK